MKWEKYGPKRMLALVQRFVADQTFCSLCPYGLLMDGYMHFTVDDRLTRSLHAFSQDLIDSEVLYSS